LYWIQEKIFPAFIFEEHDKGKKVMSWHILLGCFLLGVMFTYAYFTLNPPPCPGCKAKGAVDKVWARLREVPTAGVNNQDDDI
jgi:hypothetical protein